MEDKQLQILNLLKNRTNLVGDIYKDIKKNSDSPLVYASDALAGNTDGNDFDHSHRVFKNCIEILSNTDVQLDSPFVLVLFYAALLHDISKTKEPDIISEIKKYVHESNGLYSDYDCDHGIRSAYYVKKKKEKHELKFYGLDSVHEELLYRVMAFHNSSTMHAVFTKGSIPRNDIMPCLLFWVADIADGVCDRVRSASTVSISGRSPKTKARGEISRVNVRSHIIYWSVKNNTTDVEIAAEMATKELSKHKLLLDAFGLPSEIYIQKKGPTPKREILLSAEDLANCNLTLDLSILSQPMLITGPNLVDVYEKIVEAFQDIKVSGQAQASNYYGPLTVKIENVVEDSHEKIHVRSTHGFNIEDIKEYTKRWLDDGKNAADAFDFGYTHGQRIKKYVYPRLPGDLSNPNFYEWKGKRKQLKDVERILKKDNKDARRAYVVIAHPVVDCHDSKDPWAGQDNRKEDEDGVRPALLAVHFRIEGDNELSAYAFLRSQEMSTFFLVNYFEIKSLLEEISEKIRSKVGSITTLCSLAYFDQSTALLDKPQICMLKRHDFSDYAENLDDMSKRDTLKKMLIEVREHIFIKTRYEWCQKFINTLPEERLEEKNYTKFKKAISKVEKKLKKMAGYKYISVIPDEIIADKTNAIQELIDVLEGWDNE